jgi:2,3-bisphosphoglycerate-dependent phosphoglycerate mutase
MDRRINERHYGALQGLSKERTAERLGRSIVMEWRRSFGGKPPSMTREHPHYDIIYSDPRYSQLLGKIPMTESLEDCQQRVIMAWDDIRQDICNSSEGDPQTSLVVAHANSLRALLMYIDEIGAHDIEGLNIPTAIPFYYNVCKRTGRALSDQAPGKFRGIYITDQRKKRSFLERRRAANDPWLWALHDDQVDKNMLLNIEEQIEEDIPATIGLEGVEEEAKRNTEVFSSAMKREPTDIDTII